MDTRRLILVFVFSFSLVMLWEAWQKHNNPQAPLATAPAATATAPVPETSAPAPVSAASVPEGNATAGSTKTEIVKVKTDLFVADVSTLGGTIVGLELNNYKASEDKSRNFSLFDAKHQYAAQSGLIGEGRNVFFAHTMAGGIPKAKVFMVIANRIYKGRGDRFMSSQTLLDSDLGKLILQNFDEVSANSFQYLIEGSAAIRARVEAAGGQVRYSAYGYHGTEILQGGAYQWQTYTNYTQGYAKMRLERIAQDAWAQGIKATVYNCPEIRTNSTDVFAGVELPLIALLRALKKEGGGAWAEAQWQACRALLAEGVTLDTPIKRGDQTITRVQVRKPNAGALRGLSLVEVLQMNVTALQTLLPRVTEPPLLKNEVANMDPADLVALGTEVVAFLVPKAQREAFQPE